MLMEEAFLVITRPVNGKEYLYNARVPAVFLLSGIREHKKIIVEYAEANNLEIIGEIQDKVDNGTIYHFGGAYWSALCGDKKIRGGESCLELLAYYVKLNRC